MMPIWRRRFEKRSTSELPMDHSPEKSGLCWELVESRRDRSYKLFSVYINRSRSPRTGQVHEFQVLDSPDWVAVIAVTPQKDLVMVKQYRHGTGELSLEPPGGLVKEGQSPEQSAREELQEETGYVATTWESLGWMHPMPALFTNKFHVFLARDAVPTGQLNPDETEEIETVLLPLSGVKDSIRLGRIRCSVMIAALHLFLQHER